MAIGVHVVDDDDNEQHFHAFGDSRNALVVPLTQGQSNFMQSNFGPFTMAQTYLNAYWIAIFTPHEDML